MRANVTLGRLMVFRSDLLQRFKRPPGGLGGENIPSRPSNRTSLAGNVLFIGKNS